MEQQSGGMGGERGGLCSLPPLPCPRCCCCSGGGGSRRAAHAPGRRAMRANPSAAPLHTWWKEAEANSDVRALHYY